MSRADKVFVADNLMSPAAVKNTDTALPRCAYRQNLSARSSIPLVRQFDCPSGNPTTIACAAISAKQTSVSSAIGWRPTCILRQSAPQ